MDFLSTLSEQEQQFFKCLQNVGVQTLLGFTISNVIKDPDVSKFRGLVIELKSQANDDGDIMLSVLGQQCFDNLLAL